MKEKLNKINIATGNTTRSGADTYNRAKAFQKFLGITAESFEMGKGYYYAQASHSCTPVTFNGDSETSGESKNEQEQKRRVAVCREMYDHVGIVGNMIDIMVDFALAELIIEHSSKRIKDFYINWARRVDLFGFCEAFLKCYYRDGNIPIFKIKASLPQSERDKLYKRVISEESRKNKRFMVHAALLDEDKINGRIPVRYRILDVLSLERQGSDLLGTTSYKYRLASNDVKALKNPVTEQEKEAVRVFRESLGENVFKTMVDSGRINIQPERLDVVFYKKDQWQKWATPMLFRISSDVKFKKLLRDMDISLAEGVVNALVVVKLGRAEKGFNPGKAEYRKMVQLLKNPAKSKTIVWNDLVTVEQIYPPIEKMLSKDKYAQVNTDIRAGVGTPGTLLGEEGNFSNNFLSIKTLFERLETGRQILKNWIAVQMQEVADSMGFQRPALVKMPDMAMGDEEVERRFLLELVDRNMISSKTILERTGENFEIEIERMKLEDLARKELSKDHPYALRKLGKFGPQIAGASLQELTAQEDGTMTNDPGVMPPLKKTKQLPSGQEENGKQGGRPRGIPRTRQETSPKKPSKSFDIDASKEKAIAIASVERLSSIFTKSVVKSKGYNNLDELNTKDLSNIYSSIIKVLCYAEEPERIDVIGITDILSNINLSESGAKLERCVKDVVRQKVNKFRKDNSKAPDSEKLKDITSSAWAICRSQGLK